MNKRRVFSGMLLLAALSCALAPAARAADFFADTYYRLSTEFRGADMCLDVYNGGQKNNLLRLDNCQNVSGQSWVITQERDGYYRLTTQFRGDNMCLDVVNGGENNNRLQLAPCGNFSGQLWSIMPSGSMPDAFRLSSAFRDKRCADIVNGGSDNNDVVYEPCQNVTGQYWYIEDQNGW
jgi:hypothetical protein